MDDNFSEGTNIKMPRVFLKFLSGKTVEFENFDENRTTGHDLKLCVEAATGNAVERQRLICYGKGIADDDVPASQFGAFDGASIYVVLRLRSENGEEQDVSATDGGKYGVDKEGRIRTGPVDSKVAGGSNDPRPIEDTERDSYCLVALEMLKRS